MRNLVLAVALVTTAVCLAREGAEAQTPDDEELLEAIEIYQAGQFTEAKELLEAISIADLSSRDQAILRLFEGLILYALGQPAPAREAFERAMRLDPNVRLDPNLHAPDRIRLYNEIREEITEEAASVWVTPYAADLDVGQTEDFDAAVRNLVDEELPVPVRWRVTPESLAVIDERGHLRALSPGRGLVLAEAGTAVGRATLRVGPEFVPVSRVLVSPSDSVIEIDETLQLDAVPMTETGHRLPNREVEWAAADTAIAVVDGNGLVVGRSVGMTEVLARSEGVTGRARIRVSRKSVAKVEVEPAALTLRPRQGARLQAIAYAADGSVLPDREVRWYARDTAIVRVRPNGHVLARAEGRTQIVAHSEGREGVVRVHVARGGVTGGTAFFAGLLIPGLGQYLVGESVAGTVVLLSAAGAGAAGYLVTEVEVICAVPTNGGDCPESDVLGESTDRPYLLYGVGAAGAIALIGSIHAAIAAGDGGEAWARFSGPRAVPIWSAGRLAFAPRAVIGEGGVDLVLFSISS